MVGIRLQEIIDIDEFGAFVEMYNRNNSKAAIGRRFNEPGQYNHSTRLNVMVGISGAVATPVQHAGRWVDMWTEGGTGVNCFMDFIDDILEDIG